MMRATLDLLGIYKYHPTLFNKFVIPEALDKETLTDNLLMESAEMEILYPDADFLEAAIGSWSKKMIGVWNELFDTTQYEYNPIWNKDGTIEETITRNLATTEDVSDNNTRTDDLTEEQTRDLAGTTSDSGSSTESVYGFNSSTAAPASSNTATSGGSTTDTGSITVENTGTQTDNRTIDRDTTDTGTITTSRTEQGNIGLTSTQDLIKAQREVVQLNLYDVIIKDFIARFCLAVY